MVTGTSFLFSIICHNILGIILPIDELIFFKMVKTTNQINYGWLWIYDLLWPAGGEAFHCTTYFHQELLQTPSETKKWGWFLRVNLNIAAQSFQCVFGAQSISLVFDILYANVHTLYIYTLYIDMCNTYSISLFYTYVYAHNLMYIYIHIHPHYILIISLSLGVF